LLLAASLVSLGALTVWRLEYQAPDASITTIGRAFSRAMVTTTTVGYGDEYPVTVRRRRARPTSPRCVRSSTRWPRSRPASVSSSRSSRAATADRRTVR
jgi:hypothetical protein